MYRYETHLHTAPVSRCASAGVRETLEYYKELGYDGVFITNHFLDGNINISSKVPYEERLDFYYSAYHEGVEIGKELGLKVFSAVELSYMGIDFLVYGLDQEWYRTHPEIMDMPKKQELAYLMEQGALVIHAHPFREDQHIDYIRLYPRQVHGVETVNASRREDVNDMARLYADHYGLLHFAGSDNHIGRGMKHLAGMCCERPITDEWDFVKAVMNGEMEIFRI